MTSFAAEEFAPDEFFRAEGGGWGGGGRGQICNDELLSKNSKNVDFDCIMKAFFDENNKFKRIIKYNYFR